MDAFQRHDGSLECSEASESRQLRPWKAPSGASAPWSPRFCGSAPRDEGDEAYGANRHAAATLMGFAARSRGDSMHQVKVEPTSGDLPPVSKEQSVTFTPPEGDPPEKKRKAKKRKATHTIRKEQKAELEREIRELEARLDALKFQALRGDGDTASHPLRKRAAQNTVLRESISDQHLVVAKARALLAGHAQQNVYRLHPTEMKICLGADRAERRATLSALREPKLREARRFMRERSHGLDLTREYLQEERYETAEGDYCVNRFDVTPLRGVQGGVQAVFAALQQAAFNAEIIISETSGNITIREDDDLGDENLSQLRLVTTTTSGVHVENNVVLFSDMGHYPSCSKLADGGSYAIMASDFVDEDALYPYRPHERIRRDATSVIMVTSYVDTKVEGVKKEDGEGELVVVISRCACATVRHTDMDISDATLFDLHAGQVRWADTQLACVRQTLGLATLS